MNYHNDKSFNSGLIGYSLIMTVCFLTLRVISFKYSGSLFQFDIAQHIRVVFKAVGYGKGNVKTPMFGAIRFPFLISSQELTHCCCFLFLFGVSNRKRIGSGGWCHILVLISLVQRPLTNTAARVVFTWQHRFVETTLVCYTTVIKHFADSTCVCDDPHPVGGYGHRFLRLARHVVGCCGNWPRPPVWSSWPGQTDLRGRQI